MTQTRSLATVVVIATAVALALAGASGSIWATVQEHGSVLDQVVNDGLLLAMTAVGSVVAAARPRNAVGWFLLAAGAAWALGNAGAALGRHTLVVAPGSLPAGPFLAIAGSGVRSVGWYCLTLGVPMYYPDGVLGRRWRWLRVALAVVVLAGIIDPLTDRQADLTGMGHWHNPVAPHGPLRLISAVAFLLHVPGSVLLTAPVVWRLVERYRGGDPVLRQQIRLLAAAVAVTVISAPIALGIGGGGWIFGLTALPLPVAIGFAVLAQGLYDLRTAANRTMVWVTLSALVAGIYALVIRGVSALMHTDSRASWLTWVGAGVVAVSFAPLRDALQSGVNRVTYGRWDQPYDVLAALGQRLEATGDVDRLLQDVGAELAALGLQDVVVEDEHGVVLVGDAEASELASLQLTAYGEPVGRLAYRDPSPPLRNRDRQLLDDLAGHLGGVLHARRLTTDLERARERLVLAREEERRRLRRDLHDGLGPALAGHLLRLDVVAGRLRGDPAATAEVDRLREELRATVAEVRRVVEGLRPPALDELGLVGALDQVVQRLGAGADVAIRLDVDDLPTLPAAVEVAAYRIVTEAVTNVVRHASASRCDVRIRWANGRLDLRVTDDGVADRAAARARRGHGLQTMRERAEELRGRLTVRLTATGSTVHAQLPVTPAQRLPSRATAGAR